MSETKLSYPLQWPVGYERTTRRESSMFKQTFDKTQRFLREEIRRLNATDLVVSTNLRTRTDGGIYASDMDKLIDDPGVAIYFKYKGKEISICCDKYRKVWENIYAIAKGIEALRGMDRWGVSDFLDRAFTGFQALPPAAKDLPARDWWVVLKFHNPPNEYSHVRGHYRQLAQELHPDAVGGSVEKFQELNSAHEQAKKYYGL